MSKLLRCTVFAALVTTVASAMAQQLAITVGASLYAPTNGTIRSIFGNKIEPGIGLSPFSAPSGLSFQPSVGFISVDANGNKLALVPLDWVLQGGINIPLTGIQPYFKIGPGIAYVDYAFNEGATHYSNKTFAIGGTATAGVLFAQRWRLEGSYNLLAKVNGFDFSGFSASVEYAIYKF